MGSHRPDGPHLLSPLKPALFDELGADEPQGGPRGAQPPAEGPSLAPRRLGVVLMAVGVSSKVQKECGETSVCRETGKEKTLYFCKDRLFPASAASLASVIIV